MCGFLGRLLGAAVAASMLAEGAMRAQGVYGYAFPDGTTLNGSSTLTFDSPDNSTTQLTGNNLTLNVPVLLNDALMVNGTATFTGVISGAGGIQTINWSSSADLTADNTFTGGLSIMQGFIRIGAGGATGTPGTGSIYNDRGWISFNRTTGLTLTQAVTNYGVFSQYGANTLTLAGKVAMLVNPFGSGPSATLNVNGGTLQLGDGSANASFRGDAALVVASGATLKMNEQGTTYLDGALSGAGSFVQASSGTTILANSSSLSGTTTISAGTLQVGYGVAGKGTLGTGAVVDNATLTFNRADTLTVSSAISGTGQVVQSGAGKTILTANNSYAGATTVSSGTLHVGGGGTSGSLGSGAVSVASGANLTFNRSDNVVVANTISGSGSLTNSGSGSLSLVGANTYTGATTVSGGRLAVNGSLTSDITVNSGGTLGGNGSTTGNLLVHAGGTLAPGNSIGQLNIGGNATWDAGGAFAVELGNASTNNVAGVDNDSVAVSGSLSLPSGAFTIDVIGYGSGFTLPNFDTTQNYNWTIATAGNGITGFDSTSFLFDFSRLATPFTGTWAVLDSGNSLLLSYSGGAPITPVPESGTAAAVVVATTVGLLFTVRRRKAASAKRVK